MPAPVFIGSAVADFATQRVVGVASVNTSTTFAVLAGDVIVALSVAADSSDGALTPSDASNAYTERGQRLSASHCVVDVSTATAAANATLTGTIARANTTSASYFGAAFCVFSGSSGVNPTLLSVDAQTGSLTTSQPNSAVALVLADWSAGSPAGKTWPSINGAQPIEVVPLSQVSGVFTYVVAYYADVGSAGAKTIALTAPALTTASMLAIEVLAAGPTITTQPRNAAVPAGQTAGYSVAATTSGGALSYQWQSNAGGPWTNLSGATSSTYTTPALAAGAAYAVRCNVSDSNGTSASDTAGVWAPVKKPAAWAGLYGRGGSRDLVRGAAQWPNGLANAKTFAAALFGAAGVSGSSLVSSLSAAVSLAKSTAAGVAAGVQAGASQTASVAAAVAQTVAAQASLGTAVQRALSVAASVEAAVQTALAAAGQVQAAVQQTSTQSAAASLAVAATAQQAANVQAAVQNVASRAAALEAVLQEQRAATASLDVAAQLARSAAASVGAQVLAGFNLAAQLSVGVLGGTSVLSSLNAAVLAQALAASAVSLSVQIPRTGAASADAALQRAQSAAAALQAALQAVATAQSALQAAVQAAQTAQASFSAAVRAPVQVGAQIDAMVQGAGSGVAALLATAVQTSATASAAVQAAVRFGATAAAADIAAAVSAARQNVAVLGAAVAERIGVAAALDAIVTRALGLGASLSAYITGGAAPVFGMPIDRNQSALQRPAVLQAGGRPANTQTGRRP